MLLKITPISGFAACFSGPRGVAAEKELPKFPF
jgi:hypothetical protein